MFDFYAKQNSRVSYTGWVAVCAMLALAIYSYTIATGLAGTFDSYHYLYAAQTLRQSGQLLTPEGVLYQAWPPLFPVVLSLIGAPGPVIWLNGIAMLGSLIAWSVVGKQVLPPRRIWALPLLLALGSPTLVVSKFIWSEPLFNILWASYFMLLLTWLRRGGKALGLLTTFVGCLMPLQRIVGAFLLVGISIGLAWSGKGKLVRPSRWAQIVHFIGAISGLALWQLHRWSGLVPGSLTSISSDKAIRLVASLADYGFVLGRWLVPLPVTFLHIVPVLVWVSALGLVLWILCQCLFSSGETESLTLTLTIVSSRMLFMALLISISLLAGATMLKRIGNGLHEAERFSTPLYPAFILLVLLAWPTRKRWAVKLGPGLLVAWTFYQGVRVGHNAHQLQQLPPADITGSIQRLLKK
jgi:hypothetical protein